jgi:chemotaxis protein MotB
MAARSQLLAGTMPQESVLQVVGMADRAPLDAKRADAGVNRRIELLILTNTQATAIADMFGMPSSKTAIIRESDLPAPGLLQQLRQQLLPDKGKSNGN